MLLLLLSLSTERRAAAVLLLLLLMRGTKQPFVRHGERERRFASVSSERCRWRTSLLRRSRRTVLAVLLLFNHHGELFAAVVCRPPLLFFLLPSTAFLFADPVAFSLAGCSFFFQALILPNLVLTDKVLRSLFQHFWVYFFFFCLHCLFNRDDALADGEGMMCAKRNRFSVRRRHGGVRQRRVVGRVVGSWEGWRAPAMPLTSG